MWATNAYGTFWKICAFVPFHGRFFEFLTVLYRKIGNFAHPRTL